MTSWCKQHERRIACYDNAMMKLMLTELQNQLRGLTSVHEDTLTKIDVKVRKAFEVKDNNITRLTHALKQSQEQTIELERAIQQINQKLV